MQVKDSGTQKNAVGTRDKVMLFLLQYVPLAGMVYFLLSFLWNAVFYSAQQHIGEHLLADILGALMCILWWYTFHKPL